MHDNCREKSISATEDAFKFEVWKFNGIQLFSWILPHATSLKTHEGHLNFNGISSASHKAVFLDRDGTIIEERNYLRRPEDVVIFPGAPAALLRLQNAGFKLFIVSNQSGVGRGYFTVADVEKVNRHLLEALARENVLIEKVYFAPESPEMPSRGRKPSPQFLFDARDEFNLDLANSFMIGDKLIDLQCGWNAGVRHCVLVRTGYGAQVEHEHKKNLDSATIVNDLSAAADWLLGCVNAQPK
jgi:D-glycero-D-manno-heptose 1,7-bisphosphate phosphatase